MMGIFTRLMGQCGMISGMSDYTSWLNEILRDRGWSYSELARRASVSQGLVSMVMSEQQEPSWEFCARVADALGTPRETVLRKAGHLPAANNGPTLRELYDLLSDMSDAEQKEVLEFALFRRNRRRGRPSAGAESEANT